MAEKKLKKEGRGSYDYRTDMGSGLVITKWFDSKCVYMCSTYVNPTETTEVKRWDRSGSKYINAQCPEVVREYNKSMGGVDLSDMLISLYRTQIKTKRWYIKVLFHCVDIAKVNVWLLYKRHWMQLETPKRKQKSLLKFILEIIHSLLHRNTTPTAKIGRLSKRQQTTTPNMSTKNGQLQTPSQILMSGWIVSNIGRNSVKRKENAVIVRLVRVVFIV